MSVILATAVEADEVCDPGNPMQTARRLIAVKFTQDGQRTLHRHRGTFWCWDGSCYREATKDTIDDAAWKFLEHAKRLNERGELIAFKPTRDKVGNVREALASVGFIGDADDPPFWLRGADSQPPAHELLACANGLLHVPTGELHPPTPDFFGVAATEVHFDANAPEPVQWLAYLNQVLGDTEAIATSQEWAGYTLTPDTSQQKMLYCEGPRRSGKGTYGRMLTAVLGAHSVKGPTMGQLGETFGLEALVTAPLAIISDARVGARTDKSVVTERLLSISGEDTMTVNRKNKLAWTGRLPTRIMILTNETPALAEGSGALAGRLIGLLFPNSFFGREDLALEGKLRTELPGILNWAIAGYHRLHQRGYFVQPANAREQIDEIEILGAPVKAFIRERCIVAQGQTVGIDELFQHWRHWCEDNNPRGIGNKGWFGRNLRSALPKVDVKRGTDDKRFYSGLGLRFTAEEAEAAAEAVRVM